MPTSEELLEIVKILDEEGYGALAGELLLEVNLGREIVEGDGGEAQSVDPLDKRDGSLVDLDGAWTVEQRYFDRNGGVETAEVLRKPISTDEELRFAAEFLRVRLVEPVRAWAAAEVLAGEMMSERRVVRTGRPAKPLRIEFAVGLDDSQRLTRAAKAGSTAAADKLAAALDRLSATEV